MRSSLNSKAALAIGIAAIAASGISSETGCSSTKPTEIVPGALTQVQVPKDLGAIKLTVLANGSQKFCRGYVVGPSGTVELPSTLGVISGAPNTTLTISLRAYDNANSPDLNDCEASLAVDSTNPNSPRILRQAVVSYVDQHTLFLPMPLSFACYNKDCGQDTSQTCIAGQCGSSAVSSSTLAEYTPALVDGTQDCFDSNLCFAASVPATVVDPSNCIYDVPAGVPTTAGGLNVRIAYTDVDWVADPGTGLFGAKPGVPLEQEILNTDAAEGFTVPDASKPTRFQLAPGLCSLVQAATTPPQPTPKRYHTISNVEVAVGCASKLPLLPFCAGQQTNNVSSSATASAAIACGLPVPLEPTPSAVYLVMDDSGAMYGAFGPTGYATAMSLSFASPIFKHTYVAFRFLSHNDAECTAGNTVYTSLGADAGGGVEFGLAPSVQPAVAKALLDWSASDTFDNPKPLDLQAAMRLDQGAYRHLVQFGQRLGNDAGAAGPLNVSALIFFVNRSAGAPAGGGDAGGGEGGLDAGTGGADSGTDYPLTAGDCNPPLLTQPTLQAALTAEAQRAFGQGLRTYFIVLGDKQGTAQPVIDYYNGVASGGSGTAPTGVTVLSATQPSDLAAVQQTLSSVATCLYDLPAGVDNTASLSITIPVGNTLNTTSSPLPVSVVQDPSCNSSTFTTANGWATDNGRIRLCGAACTSLKKIILAETASVLGLGDGGTDGGLLPPSDGGTPVIPDVPVTVTMPCGDAGIP